MARLYVCDNCGAHITDERHIHMAILTNWLSSYMCGTFDSFRRELCDSCAEEVAQAMLPADQRGKDVVTLEKKP